MAADDVGDMFSIVETLQGGARVSWDLSKLLEITDERGSDRFAELAVKLEETAEAYDALITYFASQALTSEADA